MIPVNKDVDDYVVQQSAFRRSLERNFDGGTHPEILSQALSGSIKLFDALALRTEIRRVKPTEMLEVGSFLGFSTRWILSSINQGRLTAVDPNLRHRIFDEPQNHVRSFCADCAGRLSIKEAFFSSFTGEGPLYDYENYEPKIRKEQAAALIARVPILTEPFGEFDFVFIDGDHRFIPTGENILLSLQMMKRGGSIVLHDALSWPDVLPAIKAVCLAVGLPGVIYAGTTGKEVREYFANWWSSVGMGDTNHAATTCDGLAVIRVGNDVVLPDLHHRAAVLYSNGKWKN